MYLSNFALVYHTLSLSLSSRSSQVVLRRDLLEGESLSATNSSDPSQGIHSLDVHMAHTSFKVLSLSSNAPRRSSLLLVQPVTGSAWLVGLVIYTAPHTPPHTHTHTTLR